MKWRVFIESPIFTKLIGDYLDDDEYSKLQTHLLRSPKAGDVIRGSGGDCLWLLIVYSKGEAETIPGPVLKQIKEAMKK